MADEAMCVLVDPATTEKVDHNILVKDIWARVKEVAATFERFSKGKFADFRTLAVEEPTLCFNVHVFGPWAGPHTFQLCHCRKKWQAAQGDRQTP
jgi:hypothetical protein